MVDIDKLLAFDPGSKSVEDDCISEISHVCGLNRQDAAAEMNKLLEFDKLCKARTLDYPTYIRGSGIPAEHHYIILQITHALRHKDAGRNLTLAATAEFIQADSAGRQMRMLDYGGGGGRDSIAFCRLGLDATLLETPGYFLNVSEGPMVDRRFSGRGLKYTTCTSATLNDREKFDYVNCVDVLEHVYNVEYALAEITAAMKDNGVLFIWGDFDSVTFNGDHLEKNRFYRRSGVWNRLMKALGYTQVASRLNSTLVECWRLTGRPAGGLVDLYAAAMKATLKTARKKLSWHILRSNFALLRFLGGPVRRIGQYELQMLADIVNVRDANEANARRISQWTPRK